MIANPTKKEFLEFSFVTNMMPTGPLNKMYVLGAIKRPPTVNRQKLLRYGSMLVYLLCTDASDDARTLAIRRARSCTYRPHVRKFQSVKA